MTGIREQTIASLPDLVGAWETFSGLAALDRLLTTFAADADLFTANSALGRLRRLPPRLGAERGRKVRELLAWLEERAPTAFLFLLRREAALLLEVAALPDFPTADKAAAIPVLRGAADHPDADLARRWEQLARTASGSLAHQVARVVIEAALEPLPDLTDFTNFTDYLDYMDLTNFLDEAP